MKGLPLGCIDSVGLKRDRQFNNVDDLTVPDDDVRSQVSAGNVLGKVVFLLWQVSSDPHSIRQVASDEVDNGLQHAVMPGGIASQVKGLRAGVQDVGQGLVPSAELTLRGGQLLPSAEIGVVGKSVRH